MLGVDAPVRSISAAGIEGGGERHLALTSALRRGDRDAALEILDRWPRPRVFAGAAVLSPAQILTAWLQREVRLHVEAARFQHALALIDRYATLPMPLDAAAARALEERIKPR